MFFTQVFRDSFFHADMHPGNIFVSYEHPEDPCYIGIDCGIVGSLNKDDKRYLAENFIAFFNRDYRKVAELHVDSGWVPRDTNVEDFEFAIRTVCEPIFEAAGGNFLRQRAAQPVQHCAPLQYGSAAAAGVIAEDLAVC